MITTSQKDAESISLVDFCVLCALIVPVLWSSFFQRYLLLHRPSGEKCGFRLLQRHFVGASCHGWMEGLDWIILPVAHRADFILFYGCLATAWALIFDRTHIVNTPPYFQVSSWFRHIITLPVSGRFDFDFSNLGLDGLFALTTKIDPMGIPSHRQHSVSWQFHPQTFCQDFWFS